MSVLDFVKKIAPISLKKIIGDMLTSKIIAAFIGAFVSEPVRVNDMFFQVTPQEFDGRSFPKQQINLIKTQIVTGIYESAELRFIEQFLPNDYDVIELGGSLGIVSCYILKKISDDKSVIVVEADQGLAGILAHNLRSNFPDRKFQIINKAIAYENVNFSPSSTSLSGQAVFSSGSEGVARITLAEIVNLLNKPYSLVCDIEGMEASLFSNEFRSLNLCRAIIVEADGGFSKRMNKVLSPNDLKVLICSKGFTVVGEYGPVFAFEKR